MKRLFLFSLVPILLTLIVIATMIGASHLPADKVITAILQRFLPSFFTTDRVTYLIVWELRLPPIAMAIIIGGALGIAGVLLQTTLNNPLASPFTLGISAGAGFGAALAIAFSVGLAFIPLAEYYLIATNAFIFAMITCLVIYTIGRIKGTSTGTLVLTGVALSFFFNAVLAFIQYTSNEVILSEIVFWLFGSLNNITWEKTGVVLLVFLLVTPFVFLNAWKLTALRVGEKSAKALGVNVNSLRLHSIVMASLLAAVSVSFTGIIGFIGLVAPHLARMIVGDDHRYLLVGSGFIGAIVLLSAHIISLIVVEPFILPIGIVTSFIGVPFFLLLVLTRRAKVW